MGCHVVNLLSRQRCFPCSVQKQLSTLQQRKVFKGLDRALEVQLAAPEYRRDRAWSLIHEVLPYPQPTSSQNQAPVGFFQTELRNHEANNHKARIDAVKSTFREKSDAQLKWIKYRAKKAPIQVINVGGHPTANMSNRLDALHKVWSDIYSQHFKGSHFFINLCKDLGPG